MKLSKNFKRSEFACKCGCGFDTVDAVLIRVLEDLRTAFLDRPILITSGNRCPKHNKAVGGSPRSQHMTGKAADFRIIGVDPIEVADALADMYPNVFGIGRANNFTHIDVRGTGARWRY